MMWQQTTDQSALRVIRLVLLVFLFIVLTAPNAAAGRGDMPDFGKYYALVIGNQGYRHLDQLPTARADAKETAWLLEEQYGFGVELLLDADRERMLWTLSQLHERIPEQGRDSLLLYYTGHDHRNWRSGTCYWLPVDAEQDKESEWISTNLITDLLSMVQAKHIVLITDACYSSNLQLPDAAQRRGEGKEKRLRRLLETPSLTVLRADREAASARRAGNSLFARIFLRNLDENRQILSGRVLFERMFQPFHRATGKPVQYGYLPGSNKDQGDFLFVPKYLQKMSRTVPPTVPAPQNRTQTIPKQSESYLSETYQEEYEYPLLTKQEDIVPVPPIPTPQNKPQESLPEPESYLSETYQHYPLSSKQQEIEPQNKPQESLPEPESYLSETYQNYPLSTKQQQETVLRPAVPLPPPLSPKQVAALHPQEKPKKGDMMINEASGMKLVYVPGGCFQMGSSVGEKGRFVWEGPVHEVCVNNFWIGRHEVTQEQWERIMNSNPAGFQQGGTYPVENVSWNDAQEFLRRLSKQSNRTYRLPTEAEWEYACRAGGAGMYCGGDTPDFLAWHEENSGHATHPAGQLQANAFGLYDMSGNVWEWCSDRFAKNYYAVGGIRLNPLGPAEGENRVVRGGSAGSRVHNCRAAFRFRNHPDYRENLIGFRVVTQ